MKRGQGTFEYVLLLGGVLLIVVLAVVLLRGIGTGAGTDISRQACFQSLMKNRACFNNDGSWNQLGKVGTNPANLSSSCYSAANGPLLPPAPQRCNDATAGGPGAGYCLCGPQAT